MIGNNAQPARCDSLVLLGPAGWWMTVSLRIIAFASGGPSLVERLLDHLNRVE